MDEVSKSGIRGSQGGTEGVDNYHDCSVEKNAASLYKYTIASTYAEDDKEWAADLFGCAAETLSVSGRLASSKGRDFLEHSHAKTHR